MSKNFLSEHRPVEIRHKQATRELEVEFDDGSTFTLPAELLRVESPSAEVQGHGPGQKQLIAGRPGGGVRGNEPGGRQKIEAPISTSNVMLLCPKCEQPMRPKRDKLKSGERVRICRKCGETLL